MSRKELTELVRAVVREELASQLPSFKRLKALTDRTEDTKKPRTLSLEMPESLLDRLTAAAQDRGETVRDLVILIVSNTLLRDAQFGVAVPSDWRKGEKRAVSYTLPAALDLQIVAAAKSAHMHKRMWVKRALYEWLSKHAPRR